MRSDNGGRAGEQDRLYRGDCMCRVSESLRCHAGPFGSIVDDGIWGLDELIKDVGTGPIVNDGYSCKFIAFGSLYLLSSAGSRASQPRPGSEDSPSRSPSLVRGNAHPLETPWLVMSLPIRAYSDHSQRALRCSVPHHQRDRPALYQLLRRHAYLTFPEADPY